MSPPPESPAKRQKVAQKQSMRDIPADEFVSLIEKYEGEMVIVTVGAKQYRLHKLLLCHSSTFFNGAFTGQFIERKHQKVTLESTSADTFELAIQWMYTGQVNLPSSIAPKSLRISNLLDFLDLADFLNLLGPFTDTTEEIHSLLLNRSNLRSEHIQRAMQLPPGAPARQTVIKACFDPYLESLGWTYNLQVPDHVSTFKFKKE